MSKDEEKHEIQRIDVDCAAQVNDEGEARVLLKISGLTPEQAETIATEMSEWLKPIISKVCDPDGSYEHKVLDETTRYGEAYVPPKGKMN